MSSQKGEPYILQNGDSEEWVQPQPATAAITDAVLTNTPLTADDLTSIRSYVDYDELRGVLEDESETELAFTVEGYEVTVEQSGEITVTQ